ncbi:MAG: HAD-IA family hydrolase [Nitrospinaceae bacterium]|nr:HAD-IA family hydrolase [Nitrospinaceae bacterium]|tara:strand:+ start:1092 stop:1772 length:681 start_codon:yes stop_codon:yes gene_type:complete
MIDSIIFDLDGTLIDSLPDVLASLNLLLAEEKRRPLSQEELRSLIGRGVNPMIEGAYGMTGKAIASLAELEHVVNRYLEHYKANPVGHTVVFPNVIDTLGKLKEDGFRMGVCTNKPYEITLLVLEGLGMNVFFNGVTGGDSLTFNKPDPRHILVTLDLIKSDPSRAVMVGDSRIDAEAGRNAGLSVIAVAYGYRSEPVESLGADVVIDDFGQLPQAITQLCPVQEG